MLTAEFVAKPAKPFRGEIVTKEFHRVRIRQIQCGITIETRQPGTPFLVLQKTNQLCQIAYSRIAVILYGLPGMFGRIVSWLASSIGSQVESTRPEIDGEALQQFSEYF